MQLTDANSQWNKTHEMFCVFILAKKVILTYLLFASTFVFQTNILFLKAEWRLLMCSGLKRLTGKVNYFLTFFHICRPFCSSHLQYIWCFLLLLLQQLISKTQTSDPLFCCCTHCFFLFLRRRPCLPFNSIFTFAKDAVYIFIGSGCASAAVLLCYLTTDVCNVSSFW